jgi:hypothetical protein
MMYLEKPKKSEPKTRQSIMPSYKRNKVHKSLQSARRAQNEAAMQKLMRLAYAANAMNQRNKRFQQPLVPLNPMSAMTIVRNKPRPALMKKLGFLARLLKSLNFRGILSEHPRDRDKRMKAKRAKSRRLSIKPKTKPPVTNANRRAAQTLSKMRTF